MYIVEAAKNPIKIVGNKRIEDILKEPYPIHNSDFNDKELEYFSKRNLKPLIGGPDNEVLLCDDKGKLFVYNFDDGLDTLDDTGKTVKDYENQLKKYLK